MDFCRQYNAATEAQRGNVIPVEITIFEDRSFTFITKTPDDHGCRREDHRWHGAFHGNHRRGLTHRDRPRRAVAPPVAGPCAGPLTTTSASRHGDI